MEPSDNQNAGMRSPNRISRLLTNGSKFVRASVEVGPKSATRKALRQILRTWLSYAGFDPLSLEQRLGRKIDEECDRLGSQLAEARAFMASLAALLEQQQQDLSSEIKALAAELQRQARDSSGVQHQSESLSAELKSFVAAMQRTQEALKANLNSHATSRLNQADSIRNLVAALTHLEAGVSKDNSPSPALLKLSVILPVYDRANMVAAAIRSVLAQQDVNVELVVIDDGSTDRLAKTLEPFMHHPMFQFLRQEHTGAPAARNRGVAASSGDVVVYLDSDNVMYPGYLKAVADAYAAAPDAQCAFAAMLWDEGHSVHLRHDTFDWEKLLAGSINLDLNCFSHRRSLWDKLGGFDETLTKHADYDLALRYTKFHAPIRINAVSAHYNQRRDYPRLSHSEPSLPNFLRIRAKHIPERGHGLRALFYLYDYPQLSESYIETEISWLARQGVKVEVFALEAPSAPGRATVPFHMDQLDDVVRDFMPDVIHCHWLPQVDETIAALASDWDLPITVRGHGFEFSAETLQRCIAQPAVKSVYLFPHFAATCTDQSKIRAVPASFSSTRYFPRQRKDRRLVLRTGACLPTKDFESFIKVAALCPEYRFVLVLARVATLPDLPAELCALNDSLGSPVEIRFDMQYDEMAELTAAAGVYLHTFSFTRPFGMPVSIAESLACGAIPLVRDCLEARAYAGPDSLYYETPEEAAGILRDLLDWSDEEWRARSTRNADYAYAHYADDVVLPAILDDWLSLVARGPNQRSPNLSAETSGARR